MTHWGSTQLIKSIKYEFQDQNSTEFWNSVSSHALGIYIIIILMILVGPNRLGHAIGRDNVWA